jgi:thiol:disulfide interchange protein DsbC
MTVLRFISMFCVLGLCWSASFAAEAGTDAAWLKGLPLDKAIRVGNGSHLVVEVSDPDCRFSRRMSRYWNMRKDVTRYIFLVAMKNHPDAPQKARYILAAADQARAYDEVFSGGIDFDEKKLDQHYDDGGLLELHRGVAAKLGAIGTPTYFVEGVMISGAKVSEIEQLLGGEKIPFDAGDTE